VLAYRAVLGDAVQQRQGVLLGPVSRLLRGPSATLRSVQSSTWLGGCMGGVADRYVGLRDQSQQHSIRGAGKRRTPGSSRPDGWVSEWWWVLPDWTSARVHTCIRGCPLSGRAGKRSGRVPAWAGKVAGGRTCDARRRCGLAAGRKRAAGVSHALRLAA
jgi:hypothetical protein